MLILSARKNERIMLGDGVTVTVTRIEKEKVRLGFDAPSDVTILREKLVHSDTQSEPEKHEAAETCSI